MLAMSMPTRSIHASRSPHHRGCASPNPRSRSPRPRPPRGWRRCPGGSSCSIGGRCCSGTSRGGRRPAPRTVDSATENRPVSRSASAGWSSSHAGPGSKCVSMSMITGGPLRLSGRPLYSRTVLFQMEGVSVDRQTATTPARLDRPGGDRHRRHARDRAGNSGGLCRGWGQGRRGQPQARSVRRHRSASAHIRWRGDRHPHAHG